MAHSTVLGLNPATSRLGQGWAGSRPSLRRSGTHQSTRTETPPLKSMTPTGLESIESRVIWIGAEHVIEDEADGSGHVSTDGADPSS
jgi:hypothetical protein